jgi:hypothetical protein
MCAAHAQEAAANVEQMAAIVKVAPLTHSFSALFALTTALEQERAKDVEMTKRRITVLEEACKVSCRCERCPHV